MCSYRNTTNITITDDVNDLCTRGEELTSQEQYLHFINNKIVFFSFTAAIAL